MYMYAFLAIELFTRVYIYIYGILPEPEFNLTEGIG